MIRSCWLLSLVAICLMAPSLWAWNDKGHIQYVDLFRQDVILEFIMENHDRVIGNGTANQYRHGFYFQSKKTLYRRYSPGHAASGKVHPYIDRPAIIARTFICKKPAPRILRPAPC